MDLTGRNEYFLTVVLILSSLYNVSDADGGEDGGMKVWLLLIIGGIAFAFFLCCACIDSKDDPEEEDNENGNRDPENPSAPGVPTSPHIQIGVSTSTGTLTRQPLPTETPLPHLSHPPNSASNGQTQRSSRTRGVSTNHANETRTNVRSGSPSQSESIPMQPLLPPQDPNSSFQDPPSYYSLFPENR